MHGIKALVIEEEYLIAADIEQTLRGAGVTDLAVHRDIDELPNASSHPHRFDLAVIEARFGHPDVIAFATHLAGMGVAVVVTSADRAIQKLFPHAIGLDKPFDSEQLLAACEAARRTASPPAEVS